MEISDPREDYLSLISLDKSHVNTFPPIVFLFGGGMEEPPRTVRKILYDHILVKDSFLYNCLVIPEDFKDWIHDSAYPDLLEFESDLAQTSSLIIIALESAGSIAELGSFSVNDALKDKIMIIICEYHHSQSSFITLGPLRQLNEENVFSYPYNHKTIGTSLDDYLENIVDNINNNIKDIDKTEQFNAEYNGHVALLIYDLIVIFKALKLKEILAYLKLLSCERNSVVTKRLLFLLSKLLLVDKKRISNVDYYIPLATNHRLKFSSIDKHKLFSRSAASIGTSQYYSESDKEKMRRRVIEQTKNNAGAL